MSETMVAMGELAQGVVKLSQPELFHFRHVLSRGGVEPRMRGSADWNAGGM